MRDRGRSVAAFPSAMSDEVVTLNVGGQLYTTTKATLTKYPDSMLGAMFGGQFISSTYDAQGNYFIDRDGTLFRHVLNFLRSGRLCLPQKYGDMDLLEAEADFYQIPPLIVAVRDQRIAETKEKQGYYLEILDFEESAFFCRLYSDPPHGIRTELKNGGVVISGARAAMQTLPLPEKTMRELESNNAQYRTVNISSSACSKMAILHHLNRCGWQLITTGFVNNTDNDGSYMVHKYLWFLAT